MPSRAAAPEAPEITQFACSRARTICSRSVSSSTLRMEFPSSARSLSAVLGALSSSPKPTFNTEPLRDDDGALDDVLQLTDVAGGQWYWTNALIVSAGTELDEQLLILSDRRPIDRRHHAA